MKVTFIATIICLILAIAGQKTTMANEPKNTGSIIGKISDQTSGQMMEYANIKLFSISDSSLVTGTITMEDGSFEIDKIQEGNYYLEISFIGFDSKIINNVIINKENKTIDIGQVSLTPTTQNVGEVNIVAEKARVEYHIDKRVVNVTKDIANAGGSAVDVLESTPSINVESDGTVKLRGSAEFTVLIDDKPTVLKGSDALKQIPASTIENIEIITNPSAKYDAEGMAGIINIKTKKSNLYGFNGIVNGSYATGDKYTLNSTANYRYDKLNFFIGGEYIDKKQLNELTYNCDQNRADGKTLVETNNTNVNFQQAAILRGGIDYYTNEKNSFSVSGSWGDRGYDGYSNSEFSFENQAIGKKYSSSLANRDVYGRVNEINLDYTRTFGENHSLMTTFHFDSWNGHKNQDMNEFDTQNDWTKIDLENGYQYLQDEYSDLYRINLDYKRPLGENGKIEAGYQYRIDSRNDKLSFFQYDSESKSWTNNTAYSNHMDYSRAIQSLYSMYASNIWGINYQIGLRAEYTDRDIQNSNQNQTLKYESLSLFPSAHITKELSNNQQIQISYSRRITRPVSWLLNETPSYMDPNNIFIGNPAVKPQFTNSYELNYHKTFEKITLSAQVFYRHTLNSFTEERTMDNAGVTTHQFINAGNDDITGLELNANFDLLKWFKFEIISCPFWYQMEGTYNDNKVKENASSIDMQINTTFIIKNDWRIQFKTYATGPWRDISGERDPFTRFTLGLNKSFLDGKATLGITAWDIFNTQKWDYHTNLPNSKSNYRTDPEQVININFSYRFNNYTEKQRGSSDKVQFGGNSGL